MSATTSEADSAPPVVPKKKAVPKLSPVEACQAAIVRALKNSDTLQYLLDAVAELGGTTVDRVKCLSEENKDDFTGAQAGYVWERSGPNIQRGDIVLLADLLPSGSESELDREVEKNLRHELIHAFDDARGEIDPTDCDHHACSEIRAARLSGDCFWRTGDLRGSAQGAVGIYCVEARATTAVDLNPYCRGYAERAVERMFPKCYKDYEPFVRPLYDFGHFLPKRPEWK